MCRCEYTIPINEMPNAIEYADPYFTNMIEGLDFYSTPQLPNAIE